MAIKQDLKYSKSFGNEEELYNEDQVTSKRTRNGLCKLFIHSKCPKADGECMFSHDKTKIKTCNHFQNGSCRKGDDCDFSHTMEPERKVCRFIRERGECKNGQSCPFKHVIKPCKLYDKGFCSKGEECKPSHVPKKLCKNYSYGFCPEGPDCRDSHPKLFSMKDKTFLEELGLKVIECHSCKEIGHKSTKCPLKTEYKLDDSFYCFDCESMHQANKCTKFAE